MVEEGMIIKFIGDDGNLTKSIIDIERELVSLKKQLKTTTSGTEFNQVSRQIATYEAGLKNLNRTQAQAGGAAVKSAKDFTGLSRVIQDLPFGFLGIQNNITQLLPAAGGLGLAVSALTAGFTFASVGLQNWSGLFPSANDKIKDQVEALHKAKQALSDYVETLDDAKQIQILGAQNAQEELTNLKTLYDATQNQNIAIGKRKQLVDELQDQYPKYFANIKDEVILAGGAKDAYNKLSTAILATARARAGQDQLVGVQKDLLTVEQEQLDNAQQLSDLHQKILSLRNSGAKLTITSATGEERLTDAGAKMNKLQNEYNGLLSEAAKLQKQNISLSDRSKKIAENINTTVEQNPDALLNPTADLPKTKKKLKDNADEIAKMMRILKLEMLRKVQFDPSEFPDFIDEAQVDLFIGNIADQVNRENQPPIIITPEIQLEINNAVNRAKIQKQLQEQISTMIESSKEGLAIGIGQGIGDIISGKGFDSVFKNIANVVGDFISQIGQMLIKAAIAAQAFKKAFTALLANPIAAIGVGVGLVAIGQIIKNIALPKAKGFADGGLVFGSTFANIGEGRGTSRSNPEVVAPLDRLRDMIGNTGQFPQYLPAFELSGDTLRAWYARANKQGGLFS